VASTTTVDPSLVDTFGRRHSYLRVSLTDRCNLKCRYCMPEDGEEVFTPTPGGKVLTAQELKRLLRLFVRLGVRKVRLTGGEPTTRGDFAQIMQDIGELNACLDEPLSLGITTNGVRLKKFLPQMRAAGLRNVNLSLDTLQAAKFPFLAGKPLDWHARIMDSMRAVAEEPFFNLKLNCVLLKGANEDEVGAFVDLTESLPVEVRFLEFMPFDGNAWSANRLVPQADMIESVQNHLASRGLPAASRLPPDSLHDVARLWQVPGWVGRIGVISSMTDAFCGGCNRLRITANGELRNCLFGEQGWNLLQEMRRGVPDDEIIGTIAEAVQRKHAKLGGKRDMFELNERGAKDELLVCLCPYRGVFRMCLGCFHEEGGAEHAIPSSSRSVFAVPSQVVGLYPQAWEMAECMR
ncbi:MOCS1, partial [Symbiodinium microadriaticum]